MAKKRTKLSDEIRQAVDASGMSRYAICKQLGILQSSLSRFMSGKGGLMMASLDALAELLDLHLATGPRRQSEKG
jgi:predicted XRE-type DNA-binding protein